MSQSWSLVPLRKVLTPAIRPETVQPTTEYRLLGVRLDGGGAFLRETTLGSESAAKALFRVKEGDFVYSRLFAWRGAFGIIDRDLDGAYVSGEFPTFRAVPGAVDVLFFAFGLGFVEPSRGLRPTAAGARHLQETGLRKVFFSR